MYKVKVYMRYYKFIYLFICYNIYIYQPLRSARMWHKVNF